MSVSGRRGAELAAQVINETGGVKNRKIQLIFKDDENDPKVALSSQEAFVNEGVKFVVGPFTSGMAMAVMDYVNNNDLLLLGPTISADSLSKKDDHFIRFIASTKEQALVLAQEAVNRKHKSISVVYDQRNKGFTDQLVQNYVSLIQKGLNITPEVIAYDPTKSDSTQAALNAIVLHKPEALFLVASAEECAKMAQTLAEEQLSIQLYGPLWANTQELVRKGGTSINGMILVGGIDQEDQVNSYLEFTKKYEENYGEPPTFASMYSYETLMALAETMKASGSTDPENIKMAMIKKGEFSGVQGPFTLDAFGDNTRAYLLMRIQDGTMRKVE